MAPEQMVGPGKGMLSRRALIGSSGAAAAFVGAAFAFRGPDRRRIASVSDGRTFNRGNGAEPDTLDPGLASTQYENNVIGDMFLGLMTEDVHGNPVPGAALSFDASSDGLVYTFHLRDHLWSDGTPVTAHDYVYSYRRMMDPKTAAQFAAILYPVLNAEKVNSGKLPPTALGVKALDDRTLQIAFEIQVPYVAQLFSHYATFAVPQHVVERYGEHWLKPETIVTNGAYILKEWVPNDHIALVKNRHFYDAQTVQVERVNFYPTSDYSAALKRLRAGEIDVQIGVPSQEIGWLKYNLPGVLRVTPYMSTQYLLFNFGQKPFDDWRVRTALSLATDREVIARRVMHAGERPAYAFIPPGMPGYPGKAQIRFHDMPMQARAEKAKALLREAGFGPDNPLSFDFNVADTSDARLMSVAIQAMWQAVGVDVHIVPSDEKNHYNLLLRRAFSVAWAGWIADYRDPKDFLMLGQSSSRDLNNGAYSNPKFDALIDRSDRERDPVKRAQLLQEAEQTMLDDVAVAPVFFQVSRDLVAPSVSGWIGNDIDVNRTRYVRLDRSRTAV
jgi:oligopeptide transport system substrate-binding protein